MMADKSERVCLRLTQECRLWCGVFVQAQNHTALACSQPSCSCLASTAHCGSSNHWMGKEEGECGQCVRAEAVDFGWAGVPMDDGRLATM